MDIGCFSLCSWTTKRWSLQQVQGRESLEVGDGRHHFAQLGIWRHAIVQQILLLPLHDAALRAGLQQPVRLHRAECETLDVLRASQPAYAAA